MKKISPKNPSELKLLADVDNYKKNMICKQLKKRVGIKSK